MNTGPTDWDAETYDAVSDPQLSWGLEVLDRLVLRGDETVLDAGCGSGRVTAELIKRLPNGRVLAADASEAMVEKAKRALGDRAAVSVADLSRLELKETVDVVFSTAVFHWIPDHDRLFDRIHAALKPGGQLVAQCGGEGNVAAHARAIVAVASRPEFASRYEEMPMIWNFSSAETAEEKLRGAGFEGVRCWLEPKVVTPEQPYEFISTVTLGPLLERLPDEKRRPFVEAVIDEMDKPVKLDYVRLNIEART